MWDWWILWAINIDDDRPVQAVNAWDSWCGLWRHKIGHMVINNSSARSWCRGRGLDLPPHQLPHAPGGRIIGAPWSRYKRLGLLSGFPGQRTWPLCPPAKNDQDPPETQFLRMHVFVRTSSLVTQLKHDQDPAETQWLVEKWVAASCISTWIWKQRVC